MFDTMTMTKIVGGFCGAFLVFLLGGFAADFIYKDAEPEGEERQQAYTIDTGVEEQVVEVAAASFDEIYATADAGAGETLWRQCQACHKLEAGAKGPGPSLAGIVGRQKAAVSGYSYSASLAGMASEQWTPENLDGFLTNPSEYAPGTKMSYRGMANAEDRANLIAYLSTIGG